MSFVRGLLLFPGRNFWCKSRYSFHFIVITKWRSIRLSSLVKCYICSRKNEILNNISYIWCLTFRIITPRLRIWIRRIQIHPIHPVHTPTTRIQLNLTPTLRQIMPPTHTASDQHKRRFDIRSAHPTVGIRPHGIWLAAAARRSALKESGAAVAGEGFVCGVGVG